MRVAALITAMAMTLGLGWSATASGRELAVPTLAAAVNRCQAGVLRAAVFRTHPQLCPRPLALTQIEHRARRSLRT